MWLYCGYFTYLRSQPTGMVNLWLLEVRVAGPGCLAVTDLVILWLFQIGVGWRGYLVVISGRSQLTWLSCGSQNLWAVDSEGSVYMRIGVGPPSRSLLNPAWVPIDGTPSGVGARFTKVFTGHNDWMVSSNDWLVSHSDWLVSHNDRLVELQPLDSESQQLASESSLAVNEGNILLLL